MKNYAIVDCSLLCHRAFHSVGHVGPHGVVFGFFQALDQLCSTLMLRDFVFCFDSKTSFRQEQFPEYKASRRHADMNDDERRERESLHRQIQALRRDILPRIGFQNVLVQRGLEADDVIAKVCLDSLHYRDTASVVSSDRDLYQVLSDRVSLYNPFTKSVVTVETLREWRGVEPCRWHEVKAIAGCASDEVKGVRGVGEATAAKYVSGKLSPKSAAFRNIEANLDVMLRNLPLVTLPHPQTKPVELREDETTRDKWKDVAESLGFNWRRYDFWRKNEG